jgi:hypothetical protein
MARGRELDALTTVTESFALAEEARKPWERKWNDYYRLSHNIPEKKKHKWQTNYAVPYASALSDVVGAKLAARRMRGQVTGEDESSAIKAPKFNKFLDKQLDDLGIDLLLADWVEEAKRYGSAFIKMGWRREKAENLEKTKGMLDKIQQYFASLGQEVTPEEFLYDGPTVELMDIYDLFWEPSAKSSEEARYAIHRTEMTKNNILKNPNFSKNREKLKNMNVGNQEIGKYRQERLAALGLSQSQIKSITDKMTDAYVEVLEYKGLFDIDDDGEDERCVITVVNREFIVQLEENPYYLVDNCYVHLKYKNDPNFLYGVSFYESLKDSQYMLNDIASQANDMRILTLQPLKKFRKQANLDMSEIVVAPNMPIVLEDPEKDLIFDRPPDFTPSLELMQKAVRQIMQVAAGVNDVTIGTQDTGVSSDTLGGAQLAEETSNTRLRMPILRVDEAIQEFTDKLIRLDQQYIDRTVSVFNSKDVTYEDIAPEDLTGKFSFKIEPMSTTARSQSLRRNELIQLYNLFGVADPRTKPFFDRELPLAYNVDPEVLFEGGEPNLEQVAQMMQTMDPEQLQQYLASLPPEDQALMQKAMAKVQGGMPQGGTSDQGLAPAEGQGTETNPAV